MLAIVAAATTAVIVPYVLLSLMGAPSTAGSSWKGALALTAASGICFSFTISRAERYLFATTTWTFFYIFLGLAPLVQLYTGSDPGTTPDLDHEYDWTAIVIIAVSLLALLLGGFIGQTIPRTKHHTTGRTVNYRKTTVAALIAISGCSFYIWRIGFDTLFQSRDVRDLAVTEIFPDPVMRSMLGSLASLGLLVTVIAMIESARTGGKRRILLPAIALVELLTVVNPFGSARFVFLSVALGLLSIFGMYSTRKKFRIVSILSLVGLVSVFPILDTFRRSLEASIETQSFVETLQQGDFDSFGQVLNTAWYVDTNGITAGRQLLGVFLFWVPRSLWSGKPVDTGILLATAKDYNFENLSAPLPAEMYINFGWIGLFLAIVAVGIVLRRLDLTSEDHLKQSGIPTVLGSVLPFYMVLVWRGSLLQATSNLAVIIFMSWLCTSPRPKSVVESTASGATTQP